MTTANNLKIVPSFLHSLDPETAELYWKLGMREANIGWLPYSGEDMTKVAIETVKSLVSTAQAKFK